MKTYTKDEAAKYLNISGTSIDTLIATGELPAAKISQRWVLRDEDLNSYLQDQVRIQTEQRREAYQSGRVVHIETAVGGVRKSRKDKPVLPELQAA